MVKIFLLVIVQIFFSSLAFSQTTSANQVKAGNDTVPEGVRSPALAVPTATAFDTTASVSSVKDPLNGAELEVRLMGGWTSFGTPSSWGIQGGSNGSAEVDFLLDPNWSVGLTFEINQAVPGGYPVFYTFSFFEALANVKYRFGMKDFQPYFWGGLGANVQLASAEVSQSGGNEVTNTTTFSYPEISGGLGIEYWFHPGFNAFVQARYDFIFSSNVTTSLVPISVGISFFK